MIKHAYLILLLFASSVASGKSFSDKSPLETTDLAVCTAAAMKSGQGFNLYNRWVTALDARYKVIFPQLTSKERDSYTSERVIDKRKLLNRQGIFTPPAFRKFYTDNCHPYLP